MAKNINKPTLVTISLQNSQSTDMGLGGGKITIGPAPDFKITVRNAEGEEIKDLLAVRTISYERQKASIFHQRAKDPKVRTEGEFFSSNVSLSGFAELADFDCVYVIDTASRKIDGELVSGTCALSVKVFPSDNGYEVMCSSDARIYEFHGNCHKPERLAIQKLIHDICEIPGAKDLRFAIVNDSDLGQHRLINYRRTPLYGWSYLPENFQILYSSDSGGEALNSLMGLCDNRGKRLLMQYENGELDPHRPFRQLLEDPNIRYVMASLKVLKVTERVPVGGVQMKEGARWELRGYPV